MNKREKGVFLGLVLVGLFVFGGWFPAWAGLYVDQDSRLGSFSNAGDIRGTTLRAQVFICSTGSLPRLDVYLFKTTNPEPREPLQIQIRRVDAQGLPGDVLYTTQITPASIGTSQESGSTKMGCNTLYPGLAGLRPGEKLLFCLTSPANTQGAYGVAYNDNDPYPDGYSLISSNGGKTWGIENNGMRDLKFVTYQVVEETDPSLWREAKIKLGASNRGQGLLLREGGPYAAGLVKIGGEEGRTTQLIQGKPYLGFDLADSFFPNAVSTPARIFVRYFDAGDQPLYLEYNAVGNATKRVLLTERRWTNTWQEASVYLPDAQFANAAPGSVDFRLLTVRKDAREEAGVNIAPWARVYGTWLTGPWASGYWSQIGPDWEPSNAIDGSLEKGWGTWSNGHWLQLVWDLPHDLKGFSLYDLAGVDSNVKAATVSFSDGSSVVINQPLPNDGQEPYTYFFPTPKRNITWMRITLNSIQTVGGWLPAGLAEVKVYATGEEISVGTTTEVVVSEVRVTPALIAGLNSSHAVISPSLGQTVTWSYTEAPGARISQRGARILDREGNFVAAPAVAGGSVSWDGHRDGGEIVADGFYRLLFWAEEEGTGRYDQVASDWVYVDGTAPQAPSILWPEPAPVALKTNEPQVELRGRADPTTVSVVLWRNGEETSVKANPGPTGEFQLTAPLSEGENILELRAYDAVGNCALSSPLTLIYAPGELLGLVNCQGGREFSPNGDGEKDQLTLTFNLAGGAAAELSFKDVKGECIYSVRADLAAGANTLVWDGKDYWGRVVPDGDYTYTLILRQGGVIAATATGSVRVDTEPPLVPSLFLPQGITLNRREVTLSWESVPGASFYRLVYSPSPDLSSPETRTQELKATGYTVEDLEAGTWYWRVEAVDAAGNKAVSPVYSFTVGGRVATGAFGLAEVHTRPNPFSPNGDGYGEAMRFSYILLGSGQVTVKIYTLKGRLVRCLASPAQAMGPGEIVWDGRDSRGRAVEAGLYLAVVEGRSEQNGEKVVARQLIAVIK